MGGGGPHVTGGRPPLPGETAPATLRRRAIATLIDLVLSSLVGVPTVLLLRDVASTEVLAGVLLAATSVPTLLVEAAGGRSLGKASVQLRHTRGGERDGPDLPAFVVRWASKWLVPGLLALAGPGGLTWAVLLWLVDGVPMLGRGRRALHDRIAGTQVWELVTQEP